MNHRMWPAFLLLAVTLWGQETGKAENETLAGWTVAEGDILAGRAGTRAAGYGGRLWRGGRIPYELAPDFVSQKACLAEAMAEWNTRSAIKLVPRAGESDYVLLLPSPTRASASPVGMLGGEQPLFLEDGDCEGGLYRTMVHEIGHTVGLYHEHQRPDRDRFIKINPAGSNRPNVFQDIVAIFGTPLGPYDFASVMHYGPLGGAPTGEPAIETIPKGIPTSLDLGKTPKLSAGDLDAVQRMYGEPPRQVTISTNPPGLDVMVDGQRRTAPVTVTWAEASTHTLEAISPQAREGVRFEFGRWNNEGRQSQTLAAGALTHYAANFSTYVRVRGMASDPERGTVTLAAGAPGGTVPADGLWQIGTPVKLTAAAAPGYFFAGWERGRGTRNPLLFPAFHVDAAVGDFVARFEPYPVTTITSVPPGLRMVVDGVAMTTPAQFRWEPLTTHTVDFERILTADGARFLLTVVHSDLPAQQGRVTAGPVAATITARYGAEYRVRASVSPAGSGEVSVSPPPVEGFYMASQRVQVRAEAAPGFRFAGWRLPGAPTANPLELAIDKPLEVVAEFRGEPLSTAPVVAHAASYFRGAVAPGQIVTLFGVDPGDGDGPPPVEVLFDGEPAAGGLRVAAGQVQVVTPDGLAGRERVSIQVRRGERVTPEAVVPVAAAVPGLFTADSSGKGQAAALLADGTANAVEAVVRPGQTLTLLATGMGLEPARGLAATVGGIPAAVLEVEKDAAVPGLVRIRIWIPDDTPAGDAIGVAVTAGEARSQDGVTIAVGSRPEQ